MALINGRSIKNALKIFTLEHGREPTLEEFRNLVTGNSTKKKVSETNETEEKAS